MDIYIDTGILFDDPFWKNSYNKALLDRAKSGKIRLYLSSVVAKELHKHYTRHIDEHLKAITGAVSTLNKKFSLSNVVLIPPPKDNFEKEFKDFYNELASDKVIIVIEPEDEYLPEIIDRAVWRKKPFTESKTELKDTIIWLSYTNHVKKNKIEKPYFLTTNTADFCKVANKEDRVLQIHDDLKRDCDLFTVFRHSKDFISEILEKVEAENRSKFKEIAKDRMNKKFVSDTVYEMSHEIESQVKREVDRYDGRDIFNTDQFFTGYIEASIDSWAAESESIEVDVLDDCCIVSGQHLVGITIEGYEYNAARDAGEDRHSYYGSVDYYAKVYFTFTVDTDFSVINFDITDVDLVKE